MYAGLMEVSTSDNLEYCKNLIKTHDYGRYLQCAFAPETIPYYALDAELKHIHHHVSEEMIGHIRYAWWAENIDALPVARQHPVLQALAAVGIEKLLLMQLVDHYREAWPDLPKNPPELNIDNVRWNNAGRIIKNHQGAKWRLVFKLLFV
jgi:hypothetical protein